MSGLIKTVIRLTVFVSLFASSIATAQLASKEIPYYGREFFQELRDGVRDESLLARLKVILRVYHTAIPGNYDELGTGCGNRQYECYSHVSIGYDMARVFMFGEFYLEEDDNGQYKVWDVYCNDYKTSEDFGRNGAPQPGKIPNHNIINAEHTWPQSRFSGRHPKGMQKSDLHHLFPTDNQLNSIRGNYRFGEVIKDKGTLKCPESRFGSGGKGSTVFEPPANHRGNVARALFYFSTKYDLKIDEHEEATLRKWHVEDPVDEDEVRRNDEILKAQGSRNPFIDYPELVDMISDF